ncbi:nuclear transport factor 2 family protein [Streptomyces oceani]|uniref:SnoaL-like domain-containing protein n=1 Tax=Streptomyces oceani TaxID=1075402 RepID=A0A1E7JRE1_9ACTN|nr:nuclear transport factor 2 family protein [Streptomyces oceani]OEU91354.1 hypothetical protein AN216_25310 [Streptomyces oceani]
MSQRTTKEPQFTARSPRELFTHALTLLRAKEMDRFVDLFTTDAVCEFPFAPPGAPRRLEGREALRSYLDGYTELVDLTHFPSVLTHETSDPEVLVVEFTAEGTTVATGEPYELSYVVVLRVRDGEFVGYRDYWSPLAAASATGQLKPLRDALDGLDTLGTRDSDGAA